ncbi:MAG: T9SS type A sorting domain-containing protein [Paludibacter sp.]|nr:T9SS type A sorting domain-containing protein [Paludibacter sp.]
MKRIFTLFMLIVSVVVVSQAQNATFSWFLSGGGATGSDRSADVVTDAIGNIFTANTFLNSVAFNGATFTGSAKGSGANFDNSLLITKISPLKVTLWSIYSNVGTVTPTSLATTPNGDLIVTGTIRPVVGGATTNANIIDAVGTVTTFSSLLSSTTIVQSFVAKFNSNGVLQWVKELNSGAAKDKSVSANALAADASGNVYITGNFGSSVILPGSSPVTLTTTNTTQAAFIAKLDGTTGNEIWHKASTGGIVSEVLTALTIGVDGYLYAAGDFKNNATAPIAITFGDKTFTPSIGADLTLMKIDTEGNMVYLQQRPSVTSVTARDIRVKDITTKGNLVFVAGSFVGIDGGIQFTGGNLSSTTSSLNGFIAAFNITDGTDNWHKGIFSPAIVEINGIVVGSSGRLFAFGYHYNKLGTNAAGDVDFGNGFLLTDATNTLGDLFLASYLPTVGTTSEVHLVGKGTGSEASNSLCSFGPNLYLLGIYNSSPITFENTLTSSTLGSFDFFLVNYAVPVVIDGNPTHTIQVPVIVNDNANRQIVVKDARGIESASLVDVTGRNIHMFKNSSDILNINTQGLSQGVYVLLLTTSDKQTTSRRIIIQ